VQVPAGGVGVVIAQLGLARAAGYQAQREAIGELPTALVAVAGAVAEGKIDIEGLAAALVRTLSNGNGNGMPNGRREAVRADGGELTARAVPAQSGTPGS
jgi:hypothetical protein